MFVTEKKLEKVLDRILGIEEGADKKITVYRERIRDLKDEIADLKKEKEVEETKIKHYVKMNQEKNEIELQKKTLQIESAANAKETKLMKDYYERTVKQLEDFKSEVLERLPNVNWNIEHKKRG